MRLIRLRNIYYEYDHRVRILTFAHLYPLVLTGATSEARKIFSILQKVFYPLSLSLSLSLSFSLSLSLSLSKSDDLKKGYQ